MTDQENLILRWSFDEGNGSNSQNLIGAGLDVLLHTGASWGSEANGTAKSGYSLDLSSGTSRGSVLHDERLQATILLICYGSKINGMPTGFSQILSKSI